MHTEINVLKHTITNSISLPHKIKLTRQLIKTSTKLEVKSWSSTRPRRPDLIVKHYRIVLEAQNTVHTTIKCSLFFICFSQVVYKTLIIIKRVHVHWQWWCQWLLNFSTNSGFAFMGLLQLHAINSMLSESVNFINNNNLINICTNQNCSNRQCILSDDLSSACCTKLVIRRDMSAMCT
jgi:hypothetical protein